MLPQTIVANLQTHGIGVGPNGLKMGPTEWKGRPTEFTLDAILGAEHFVHARRMFSERIHATASVADAQRYIRDAYRAGWRVPCLSASRLKKDGAPRKGFCDCVPFRNGR